MSGKTEHPHPYQSLPDTSFWKRSLVDRPLQSVDPVVGVPFTLTPESRIATAGSCFAQHISRHLRASGFNYYVTEPAHSQVDEHTAALFNYGTFTARYGNVYTARQLLQLYQRAYGDFQPFDDVWKRSEHHYLDPFRPQIQPEGFFSEAELHADRERHLAAVRQAFENLDVLVFTLGLTECWVSKRDGAVFPVCPGVAGGTFDPDEYEFKNFGVADVVADMHSFISRLRERNVGARVILTVSPVPLVATAEPQHVLVATTYSKSVLRVAAQELATSLPDVVYFPSYELITGQFTRGRYLGPDLRSVTEEGVEHVMRVFLRHYAGAEHSDGGGPETVAEISEGAAYTAEVELAAQVNCDEEALDPEP